MTFSTVPDLFGRGVWFAIAELQPDVLTPIQIFQDIK